MIALTSPQASAATLPDHIPGRHEQSASPPAKAAGDLVPGALDTLLCQPHSYACKSCQRIFVALFPGLCDACLERELESDISRKDGKLTYLKTFPERAKQFIAQGKMAGPSLTKARTLLKLLQSGRGPVLIVIGDRWTGKTVMSTWWAGMLGYGLYTKAFDLFAAVKRTYHDDSKVREHDVLERYRKADFLVIDEAQERKESDWENTLLTNLIDKRYDAMKPTVIIANLKQDALDAALGPSIIRRAHETAGGIVNCAWAPYGG
jgi:DNA replication protein DnaC